jgi:predicted helicase
LNWQSYKQSLSNLNSKQKGDSFERLTKHYLQSDPKYATKLKSVWLYGEIPSSLFKKLNLPSQDQGIDLIAETNEGEFWAIQSKYHEDEAQSQSWRSLSTFTGLAFGVCKNISFGLVCTTAERFTKTLKDQDNIGFCTGEVWRGLDEDFFESLTRQRKPKKLKAYSPFSHQKRAIRNGHKHYVSEKESRGKMIMPCGTGKSLTAFWIAEKLDAKRILVAVPSLALIRQTLRVWCTSSNDMGHLLD